MRRYFNKSDLARIGQRLRNSGYFVQVPGSTPDCVIFPITTTVVDIIRCRSIEWIKRTTKPTTCCIFFAGTFPKLRRQPNSKLGRRIELRRCIDRSAPTTNAVTTKIIDSKNWVVVDVPIQIDPSILPNRIPIQPSPGFWVVVSKAILTPYSFAVASPFSFGLMVTHSRSVFLIMRWGKPWGTPLLMPEETSSAARVLGALSGRE